MAKNTSISLGQYFEDFISSEVASGKYSSASEVVRAALRLLESEERKMNVLREALEEGENSAVCSDFDSEKYLADIQKRNS